MVGLIAPFTDRATTGTNSIESGERAREVDLQLTDDLLGGQCGPFSDDLGSGLISASPVQPGESGTGFFGGYTANGVVKGEEEFTLGATDANGMIPYTGSGKCVQGGTRVHKGEKCNYIFTGTLNPNTNVVTFNITGTTTR
jgi:hypothetical protein